jgi:hypothetical protein
MQLTQDPITTDPDNVPETLCIGKFNISTNGPLATITFTHLRNDPAALLDHASVQPESVVRARIVTTVDNLLALRDSINGLAQLAAAQTAPISDKAH